MIAQIAKMAMMAQSDPYVEAAAYRTALIDICSLALADVPDQTCTAPRWMCNVVMAIPGR